MSSGNCSALAKQSESSFSKDVESKSSQPKEKEIAQLDFEDQETYHLIPLDNYSNEENESLKIGHKQPEEWDELQNAENIDRIRKNDLHLENTIIDLRSQLEKQGTLFIICKQLCICSTG